MTTYDDFQKLDIRVGKIITVEDFPEAKKPAYKLTIDFGPEIGTKQSSAQLVKHYTKQDLQDKLILGVVNFPPRQIGPFVSEVLTLGVPDGDGECVLIKPDKDVPVDGRLYEFMRKMLNKRMFRFIFIVLLINFFFYYNIDSNLRNNYYSVTSTCIYSTPKYPCGDEETKMLKEQADKALNNLEATVSSSEIKYFKIFFLFDTYVQNMTVLVNGISGDMVQSKIGIDFNGNYMEVLSGQDGKKLESNLTFNKLRNSNGSIEVSPKLEPGDYKVKYDEGLRFIIQLSWIDFFLFLVVSIPAAWGVILLFHAIRKYILFGFED